MGLRMELSCNTHYTHFDVDEEAAGQREDQQRDEAVQVEGDEEAGQRAQERRDPVWCVV